MLRRLRWSLYLAHRLFEGRRLNLYDSAAVQRRQQQNIQRIVRYAHDTVPYYKEAMRQRGLTPGDIGTAGDLAKLPILERADLQRDPEYFVSRAVRTGDCLALKSSGSSGAPKIIWHDPAAVFQSAAHGERDRAILTRTIGRWTGYRETVIVSPIDASQRAVQEFVKVNTWFPGKVRVQRQYLLLSDPPEKNLAAMNEFRPDLLYAYGSYIEMLYRRFHRGDLTWHLPKAILYSSDGLSPQIRSRIKIGRAHV
jgi:phenylacetate-coenzyme A ligase PaaK-like adenylate-forming protein